MDKQTLKNTVFASIDENRQQFIDYLANLVRLPAFIYEPTHAQELVKTTMGEMGMTLDVFPCTTDDTGVEDDFHSLPQNYIFDDKVENVVGVKKGDGSAASLMLIAHIDTEPLSELTPDTSVVIKNGQMHALGAADSKSGVAMMLLGAKAALAACPKLGGDLTLLSSIGKRGAVGTLTAMQRGHHADMGVYLHSAETGHAFHEIKNYSMGMLDVRVTVTGQNGKPFDEIDRSEISAIDQGVKVIQALRAWDEERSHSHLIEASGAAPRSYCKLDLFTAQSSDLFMNDALQFDVTGRISFGYDETVQSVFEDLKAYLTEYFRDDPWLSAHPPVVVKEAVKGNPVYIPPEAHVVQLTQQVITEVKGFDDFIYQYHGSSEVRLPNTYGNTPTIGIGPLCGMGVRGQVEWVDLDDFIDGIKIVAGLIIEQCL